MLKSLRVKNFQSHRDSLIRFSPGVNVLVGDPQNGKTAILRALNLVRTNRPSGFRFHSHFAKDGNTEIIIETDSGEVDFLKNETGSVYSVTKEDGTNHQFTKVGVSVPDMVGEVLNLQDLNIQSQLDSPFLVGDNPADIAREINRTTKIDLVDKWVAELNRRKNAHSGAIHQMKRKSEELAGKIEGLSGIEEVGPILQDCDLVGRKADKTKELWNSLRIAANDLGAAESEIAGLEGHLLAGPILDKVQSVIAQELQVEELVETLDLFCDLSEEIGILEKSVGMIESFLDKAGEKKSKTSLAKKDIQLLTDFIKAEGEMVASTASMSGIRKDYCDTISEAGVCPLCFTLLDDKATEQILGHL